MVEIYLLEQLTAFAKCGTLSQAAEMLHITQPALSRSMKKIEEEFGVPLFDRAKSRIVLNETGKTAAEYAGRVLEADREMIERTVAFDRSRRTITLGSCASLPARKLMPALHEAYRGMAVTFPADHPLASRKTITFRDLSGLSILAHGGSGFWVDICRKNLPDTKLLVQDSMEMLSEIVDASSLLVFNSDRAVKEHEDAEGRVTVPITDEAAHVTYYLACLEAEKGRYKAVFRDSDLIKTRS